MQDKAYTSLPAKKADAEKTIEKLRTDAAAAEKISPLTDGNGKSYYPITVGGVEYHDREQAGEAIRRAIIGNKEIMDGKEADIGFYRGFKLSALPDTFAHKMKFNLSGETFHYGELNMNKDVKASGNMMRLDNAISGIGLEILKKEEELQAVCRDIGQAKAAAEAVFPQEQELAEKEKRLAVINRILSSSDDTGNMENKLSSIADWAEQTVSAVSELKQEREESRQEYDYLR